MNIFIMSRPSPGPARPAHTRPRPGPSPMCLNCFQPRPGPGPQYVGPGPARPGPQNYVEARPGPTRGLRAGPGLDQKPGPRRALGDTDDSVRATCLARWTVCACHRDISLDYEVWYICADNRGEIIGLLLRAVGLSILP